MARGMFAAPVLDFDGKSTFAVQWETVKSERSGPALKPFSAQRDPQSARLAARPRAATAANRAFPAV